jgi:hypothetical protein
MPIPDGTRGVGGANSRGDRLEPPVPYERLA